MKGRECAGSRVAVVPRVYSRGIFGIKSGAGGDREIIAAAISKSRENGKVSPRKIAPSRRNEH